MYQCGGCGATLRGNLKSESHSDFRSLHLVARSALRGFGLVSDGFSRTCSIVQQRTAPAPAARETRPRRRRRGAVCLLGAGTWTPATSRAPAGPAPRLLLMSRAPAGPAPRPLLMSGPAGTEPPPTRQAAGTVPVISLSCRPGRVRPVTSRAPAVLLTPPRAAGAKAPTRRAGAGRVVLCPPRGAVPPAMFPAPAAPLTLVPP